MTEPKMISPEKMAEIRRSWPILESDRERAEMAEVGERLRQAADEPSVCGQLRRAVHQSGLQVSQIAVAVGIDPFYLCDWLEGTRSLRSELLDRIGLAIRATVTVTVSVPPRDVTRQEGVAHAQKT